MNVFDYFFENSKNLDKDFLLGSKEKISFKNLYNNSLKVASYLKGQIGENSNVILISPNSVFFMTVYLGILKSGNTCIPLNFAIEQDNFDFILKETNSSIIFSAQQVSNKINFKNNVNVINEIALEDVLNKQNIIEFKTNIIELAEIIFTSGSTGKPKGVMISHKNIIVNTNSIIEYLKLNSDDIICVVLPFYYCYGLSLLHSHLRVGGSIVLNNSFMFLNTVINDIIDYRCTGFAGVPSHYQMLLKKSKSFKTNSFEDLRYVTQAGGKLHNVFIEEFVENFPNIEFYVMYGQTEATARLSYLPPKLVLKKMGSIGKGISGVELNIVDAKGNQVSNDNEGDLIAKGDNIMLGYYKDDEETNNVIRNGWLYTGDIAKYDEDGYIYLVARKKEIIKVGGNRVSPKEIEEVILNVLGVVHCTIKGVQHEVLGEALEATIVVNHRGIEDEIKQEILKQCKEKLALYKIPQIFQFDTKMNVKLTGKSN